MVDYRDPAQLVNEECAYNLTVVSGVENLLNPS